ncbi:MAG TPA: STAS domain-containing protein [Candidatus Binatia bacterium]|nr:STAS domain-containing protein [Candidatus Binatia bacterium]
MSLSVDCRPCGKVYVIRCYGRIVAGEEGSLLEGAIERGLIEFVRLVLNVAEVTRVDSTGMGLLVRFLSHTRNRGGDVRLAAPQPFLTTLLQLTKLGNVFRVHDSEEAAIVSFLKDPLSTSPQAGAAGPLVLFIDESPDLCAFVRTLLQGHGYEVLSTCRVRDARILLTAAKVDFIVLGPDSSRMPPDGVAASLKSLAPSATTVLLESGFKLGDPERAAFDLLQRMQARR